MKNFRSIFVSFLFYCSMLSPASAVVHRYSNVQSFGNIAESLFGTAMTVRELVKTLCIMTAIALLLSSLFQYRKHRRNPLETTLSSVITNFIVGLALLVLAFVPLQI